MCGGGGMMTYIKLFEYKHKNLEISSFVTLPMQHNMIHGMVIPIQININSVEHYQDQ